MVCTPPPSPPLPLTLQVRRATASPKWEGLAFEFPIGTWTEELQVTLHDASSNGRADRGSTKGGGGGGGGGGGALGTLHLRLLDLGDAPGKPYDAWHALRSDERRGITTDGKKGSVHGGWRNRGGSCGSFAHAVEMDGSSGSSGEANSKHGGGAARATVHAGGGHGRPTTLSRADSVDVDMGSVRVCCEWQYASARPSSARGPASGRTGEEVGGAGAGAGAVVSVGLGIGGSAEFHGVLAEAQQIKQALKARIAAQDSHIDRLHGAFDSLRDEFVLDFSTHCLHTLGELSVTVHQRGRKWPSCLSQSWPPSAPQTSPRGRGASQPLEAAQVDLFAALDLALFRCA